MIFVSSCGQQEYSGKRAPQAVKGVLDLRDWDFEKDGPVRLDGEWKFFQESLLDTFTRHQAPYCNVPGGWMEAGLPGTGYGTYQLQILVRPGTKDLGIQVKEFSTAYELDLNGQRISQAGGVATQDGSASYPEYKPALSFVDDTTGVYNIVARVSNFHHFNGGLLQPIVIGKYETLAESNSNLSRFSGFLYGLLVIIGLFHLAIWFFRRKEKYNLYYGIYCMFNALAFAFTSERFLFAVIGPGWWALSYKLFLISAPIFLFNFILFYDEFFKGIIKPWIKKVLVGLGTLFVAFVIFTPTVIGSLGEPLTAIYILLLLIVGFAVNFISMYRKLPGALPLFLCNLFFVGVFAYDGAFLSQQMGGLSFSHVASAIYVMVISFMLSRRFASTFGKVDTLSVDLIEANQRLEEQNRNLEKEVEQRTQQVVLTEKMSVLGQLTANIAHEINTPLGAIKASAQNINESFTRSVQLIPKTSEKEITRSIFSIVSDALNEQPELSPKEERLQKKKMITELETAGVTNASWIADYFVRAGLFDIKPEYYPLLRGNDSERSVALLTEQLEQIINNRNIRVAIEKVSKIMFALKTYSRFNQSGEKSESNIEADMDTVLTLYHAWMKRGIEVVTDYGNIPPLHCLVDELNQVWTNLIMNAVQAMGNSGQLLISTRHEGQNAVVRIADNGPGIPPEIREKIFDPFFTTKPHGEGSGLGLDIVKSILKKHNGSISVESVPGNTVFTVTLPYQNN